MASNMHVTVIPMFYNSNFNISLTKETFILEWVTGASY